MKRRNTLQVVIDELREFVGEIEPSDPEWTQILFNQRISSMLRKGALKSSKLPRKIRLSELLDLLDLDVPYDDVANSVEQFDDVIRSYGEEPDRATMEEARSSLENVIEFLVKVAAEP